MLIIVILWVLNDPTFGRKIELSESFNFLKSINSIKSYGIFKKSANSYPRNEILFTKYANYVPNLFKYANFSTKCAHFAVKYTYFSSKYTNFAPRSANFTFKYIIFFTQICTGLEYGNATQNTDLCYVEYCYLIFEVGISALLSAKK